MKLLLDHNVISSFKEFLVHKLLIDLEAYKNVTAPLVQYSGARRFLGKTSYSTPYCQWAYDSAVTELQIPSGIGSLERGTSGLSFDFKNGRVLVDEGTTLTGSINVTVPEFNVYVTTTAINKILLENKYSYKPNNSTNFPKPDSIVAPCIIISYTLSDGKQFNLGGVSDSNFEIQIAVLADNLFHLMGVQKLIRDISGEVFPILSLTPFNELNDLKAEYWNYSWVTDWLNTQANLVFVNKTTFKIADIDYINSEHPNILVGLGKIQLSKYRKSDGVTEEDFLIPYSLGGQPILYSNSDQVYILE